MFLRYDGLSEKKRVSFFNFFSSTTSKPTKNNYNEKIEMWGIIKKNNRLKQKILNT